MCLPNILLPVFLFAFIFHCRSFSPCWPLAFLIFSPPLWISMFFFLRNSSPLFSITRSSSFSVIHVSVNIKNNAEKDTTLLLFFLSKSPGGHVISFQIKPWVAFGLFYQRSAIRAKNSDPYQDEVLDPCCESYAQPSAWLSVTGSK